MEIFGVDCTQPAIVFHLVLRLVLLGLQSTATDGLRQPNKKSSQSVIARRMFDGYSKQEPPMLDRATVVRLGIYVNSFYSINEQTMDYTISMYLRQSWHDPRLEFQSPDGKTNDIKLLPKESDALWKPDTYFRNEKEASYHVVTVANQLTRVNSSGHIRYTSKPSNRCEARYLRE
jgi:hypothetical protein